MASETPCHGERPICGHPECRECIEYAHDAVRAPRMTHADRLAEAVRQFEKTRDFGEQIEMFNALAAYDMRERVTVEDVAAAIEHYRDSGPIVQARAAMLVMGEEP